MKKLSFYAMLACVFVTSTASTCSTDDDSNTDPQPIIDAAKTGSWRITGYVDSGNDETTHFDNYVFVFGDNNTLSATNGTNEYSGSWSVTNDHSNSNDDSHHHSSDDLDFNIAFATPASFEDLSDDWDIVSWSATKIELIDVSGGNGGTDVLTFEKVQ